MNVLKKSWTPAAIRRLAATLLAGCLLLPAVASANLITNGDFEGAGITSGGFAVNTASTYNKWLDVNQWQQVCDASNCFAQHVSPTSDNTNLLFQGFDATGLTAGTTLNIAFDYAFAQASGAKQFRIYGLNADGTLSQFAPFPVTNGSLLETFTLAQVASLTSYSTTYTLTGEYSAIVIGFLFGSGPGGSAALRAVDNVMVTASVPTPAPLALFGLGLFLVGLSRTLRTRTRQLI